jgi:hypothetical protein
MNEENISLEQRALNLSESLAECLAAYGALLSLEREQSGLIDAGDIEGAAGKISEKNDFVARIQASDKRLREESEAWQSVRERAPGNLRDRLQGQLDRLQTAMAELMEIQGANEGKLHRFGKEISGKLLEIRKKQAAHRGYQQRRAGDAYQKSKFYDKNN